MLDLARGLFASEVESVTYTHRSLNDAFPSPDTSVLTCDFSGGAQLQMAVSWAVPRGVDYSVSSGYILCPDGVVSIWGEQGSVEVSCQYAHSGSAQS